MHINHEDFEKVIACVSLHILSQSIFNLFLWYG